MIGLFKKIVSGVLIGFIRVYQYLISPLLPRLCRHTPSCSKYTVEAIQKHGPLKGLLLGAWRICRCNPWGTSGYDPVPDPETDSAK